MYTDDLGRAICAELAKGETLTAVCRMPGMPKSPVTVYEWRDARPDTFGQWFARACEQGYDAMANQCLAIADDASQDYIEKRDQHGKPYVALDTEHVQRAKLRIETRMKLLAKWAPRKYGDKLELGGQLGLTVAQQLRELSATPVPPHAPMPPGAEL
jgi:hypothetical protein